MTLFITQTDIQTLTPISQNLDMKYVRNVLEMAQINYIESILGQPLSDELKLQIETNTLTPANILLLAEIKKAQSWWSAYEMVPFVQFRIDAKGIRTNLDDSSEPVSNASLTFFRDSIRKQADANEQYLINYLDKNKTLYPLYDKSCRRGKNKPTISLIL